MANLHLCWHGGDWQCTDGTSMGRMSPRAWTYFCHQRRYSKFVSGARHPGQWGVLAYRQYWYNAILRAETQGE
ncbi:hypothetical protein [Nonomuraea sp. 10N515B]|uniref:hypothetical protein n=1 Tax=Nonomuraea sp. 10N515B TaxID=3457422 RepID=UPI003FCE2887